MTSTLLERPANPGPPTLLTPRFVAVAVAALAYFTGDGILIAAVPRFVAGPLGAGNIAVGIVVGVFSVSAFFLRPWVGGLGDRRGRKPLTVCVTSPGGLAVPASVHPSLDSFVCKSKLTCKDQRNTCNQRDPSRRGLDLTSPAVRRVSAPRRGVVMSMVHERPTARRIETSIARHGELSASRSVYARRNTALYGGAPHDPRVAHHRDAPGRP